jgi:hypothetical protein
MITATKNNMPGGWAGSLCRKRYIDDQLVNAVNDGIDTVVILGEGFEAQVYRLQELCGIPVYELGLPANVDQKPGPYAGVSVAFPPIAYCDRSISRLMISRTGWPKQFSCRITHRVHSASRGDIPHRRGGAPHPEPIGRRGPGQSSVNNVHPQGFPLRDIGIRYRHRVSRPCSQSTALARRAPSRSGSRIPSRIPMARVRTAQRSRIQHLIPATGRPQRECIGDRTMRTRPTVSIHAPARDYHRTTPVGQGAEVLTRRATRQ